MVANRDAVELYSTPTAATGALSSVAAFLLASARPPSACLEDALHLQAARRGTALARFARVAAVVEVILAGAD